MLASCRAKNANFPSHYNNIIEPSIQSYLFIITEGMIAQQ